MAEAAITVLATPENVGVPPRRTLPPEMTAAEPAGVAGDDGATGRDGVGVIASAPAGTSPPFKMAASTGSIPATASSTITTGSATGSGFFARTTPLAESTRWIGGGWAAATGAGAGAGATGFCGVATAAGGGDGVRATATGAETGGGGGGDGARASSDTGGTGAGGEAGRGLGGAGPEGASISSWRKTVPHTPSAVVAVTKVSPSVWVSTRRRSP